MVALLPSHAQRIVIVTNIINIQSEATKQKSVQPEPTAIMQTIPSPSNTHTQFPDQINCKMPNAISFIFLLVNAKNANHTILTSFIILRGFIFMENHLPFIANPKAGRITSIHD